MCGGGDVSAAKLDVVVVVVGVPRSSWAGVPYLLGETFGAAAGDIAACGGVAFGGVDGGGAVAACSIGAGVGCGNGRGRPEEMLRKEGEGASIGSGVGVVRV